MVWTTNNGIHFFRRPSHLLSSLFLSSWYSSSFARSRDRGAWYRLITSTIFLHILFFTAVLVPLGDANTPLTIRVDPREWKLHVDETVGKKIATIYVNGGEKDKAVYFSVESIPNLSFHNTGISSSYDWSSFFKITRRNNGNGIVRLKKSLEGAFQPGQKFEVSILVSQEGGDFSYRHNVHVQFEPPLREFIEYETDPESEFNTTLKPGTIPTEKPRQKPSSHSEPSHNNTTKESNNETVTNATDGQSDPNSDTNATIYAGIVIGIIMLIVIALMVYLSRKKLRPWLFSVLYRDKDGAKIEDANGEFGFPSNGHELQKSPSSATGILALSYSSGPSERKISTSSSIGANSYASNLANTTITTIADETILEEDSKWEFPRHRLRQRNLLGEGGFGQVWKFEADNIDGHKGSTTVAVKMLKANASESEKRDLLQELAIMKLLDPHPNVVRLLGCCTEKDPIYVILDYVNGGTLQTMLKKSRSEHNYRNLHGESQSLSSRDLTSFAYQIAKGMAYLSSKRVIHRDLAARNILVDTNGNNSYSAVDQWKCKIADFGFARDIMANNMYERKTDGKLPIRWMAPETIQDNLYTAKSDVWSFGVLMWEIVTLGSTPYVGMGAKEVIKYVNDGNRLQMPKHCKRELYNIMFYCWNSDPSKRPEWSGPDSLIEDFEKLLLENTDYIDLNMYPEHEYYNEVDLSGEKV